MRKGLNGACFYIDYTFSTYLQIHIFIICIILLFYMVHDIHIIDHMLVHDNYI
jgi:hypothetical protein